MFETKKQLFIASLSVWRLASALDSLLLIVRCISACMSILGWSLVVLVLIQCMAGMCVSQLVSFYLNDDSKDVADRQVIFDYYGTATRSIITMFEVTLANWGPPCRALVNLVGEPFGYFLLTYRCVCGFAVLNVISAVFIQQTMKAHCRSPIPFSPFIFRRQMGSILSDLDHTLRKCY